MALRRTSRLTRMKALVSDPAVLRRRGSHGRCRGAGVEIVSEVSLSVPPNHTLGIVGESGCGKTTVAMALLGFARPGTQIVGGRVPSTAETSSR